MIASANGKPIARAPAIVKLNAASRFTSGRSLSTDMLFFRLRGNWTAITGTMRLTALQLSRTFPAG